VGTVARVRPEVEFIVADAGREWAFQTRAAEAFPFAWHAHDELELTIIAAGSGRRFAGDGAAPYQPGDIALYGPRLPHTYASDPGRAQKAYVAHFPPTFARAWSSASEFGSVHALLERASHGVVVRRAGDSLRGCVDTLVRSVGPRQTLALIQLLIVLAEDDTSATLATSVPDRADGSASAVTAVVSYLEHHFREPVSRDAVAAAAAMSPSSVSRLLRRQMGTSLTEYVLTLRLSAACRELTGSRDAIAAIAHRCGFANLSNFNRQFQRRHGLTPRAYRRAFTAAAPGQLDRLSLDRSSAARGAPSSA
jgi:AraC-like DNA-binding protein